MVDAKINIEVGYSSNKQEFDKINKQLEELLLKLERKKNAESDSKQKQAFEEQIKIINKMAMAYEHAFDNKTGQINISKLTQEMQKANVSVNQFQQSMRKAGQDGAVAYNGWAASILNTNIQLKESNKLLDRMATTFKNTVRYGISSSIFNNFTNSIQKAYNFTKQLDTSLNDIRIVSGKSAEEMDRFAVSANRAAQSLGKTTLDYTKAATIFYQQGLDSDEVAKRTEVTLKAANVTGQNAQEVSEQLTAVWNGYQVTGEKLEETIDKLAAVASHSASNLEELSTGMSKVASAANVMGVDIDQLNAQMSTIISVTRQAPESVGTALRTIYARIADIKAGLDDETTLGNYSGKMKKLGFDVLDASGNLKDMGDVIEEIGGKWEYLTREQQISLAQTMAGTRQYNNLLTLFDNWDKYTDALETSQNAAGTLQKQQDIYMESTEAHLKQLQAETEELYNILFDQDAARGFIDLIKEAVDILGNYIKGLGGGLETLIGLGSQFANIFSKQIATGIGGQLANLSREKENKELLQKQRQILIAGPLVEDSDEANKNNEQLFSNKQKIDSVRGVVSQEEYKELIQQEQELYLLQKQRGEEIAQYQTVCENVEKLEKKHASELEEINKLIDKGGEKRQNLDEEEKARLTELLEKTEEVRKARAEKDSWSNADATQEQRDAAHAAELQGNIDKSVEFAQRQQAIQDIIKGTTALLMTMTSVKSIFSIITDDDLSTWDKFKSIIGILVMQIPTLVTSFNSLRKMKQSLLLLTTKSTAAQTAETVAETASTAAKGKNVAVTGAKTVATNAETVATDAQTVSENAGNVARLVRNMLDHAWLTLGVAAGIGAVVLGLGALVKALFSTKSQEDKLKEAVEEANEKLEEAKNKYNELKETIGNYQSARDGLDNLTEGTLEFYDAILKSNEEAQKLIDKWGLLANEDYTIDKNGLINIDEDVLKERQFREQQSVYRDSANVSQANLDLQNYYLKESIEGLRDEINNNNKYPYAITYEQAAAMLDGKFEWGISLDKHTDQVNENIGELNKKVLTGSQYEKVQTETTTDITEAIKTYLPQYNNASAKVDANSRDRSDKLIRGYGSQEEVKAYNDFSQKQKEIVQDIISNNINKYQSQTEDYYRSRELLRALSLSGGGSKLTETKEDRQDILDYFKNVYGYTYNEETGKYLDRNSRVVSQDTIGEIIDSAGGYGKFRELATKTKIQTGNYTTVSDFEKLYKEYENAIEVAQKQQRDTASQKLIAEAYTALISGQSYDDKNLTDNERKIVNELFNNYDKNLRANSWWAEAIPTKENPLSMTGSNELTDERVQQNAEIYNETLKEQAKLLETTDSALVMYAASMKNAGDLVGEQDEAMAKLIADSYKFNKSYNNAVKIYEKNADAIDDWTEAWKNHEQVNYETADAMGALYDELTKIFSKDFSVDIMLNNMDLVKQMLTGTEEEAEAAYRALESLNIQNIFNKTFGEDAINNIFGTQEALEEFANHVAGLDFGESIGKEYFDKLRDMVNTSEMTKDQVEALFSSMHLQTPPLEITNQQVEVPGETTRHEFHGHQLVPSGDGTYMKSEPIDYYWDETVTPKTMNYVSIGKDVKAKTVKSTLGGGNFKKSPLSTGSGKKGSGSSAKPSKKDPNKDELDRYQLVNVQLKEISKQLSKLDKEKNKLLGGNLVKNLNTQIKLLNDQITVTEAKLKIAKQEQAEVAGKLSGYGVKFDSEGNIANYAAIFKQEQAKLNAVYTKFNGMSKDAQEAYQDTVKAAEESWKTFKDSITKYDNLIGETIPQLQQDIQDAFDKQTEMYIQEFNAEIKVRLDMSSAERDWNEFKRKVLDGIKDDDILGMATAKLKDFYSYYNEAGTAEIQSLTKQLEGQLEELRKQDEEGSADWYRDNRVKAIEDLKDNYDKIRKSLEDIVALEEEMQQKLLDMLNEAQEKFDDQVGTFENINKQLEHNIELINLLTDQNDYETLAQQYAAQTKNRKEELDFYTKQKEFWEMYLTTLEQGSKEWEVAKEKYNAAAEAWASALETTIQAARQEFENNINLIFKTINNQLTNNKGLDYLNEEWELLASNSDLVLDNINRMQKMQDLTKKYNDAINSTSNIKAQQTLAQLRDSELDSLKAMGQLSEKDLERAEKKLDIVKAQIALEDAQRNKSQMRLRRDSQGNYRYQFVADEDQINQAQQNLYSAYNELYNFDKARYTETLKQAADAWKEYQEKMAEAALINDPEVRAQKEALIKEQYDEQIGILHEQLQRTMQELNESTFAELNALYAENEDNYELMTLEQQAALNDFNAANQTAFDLVFDLYTENTEKFHDMAQDQIDVIQNQMVPQWTSGYQDLVDAITGEGGIEEVSNRLMDKMQTAVDDYNTSLEETEAVAGNTFDTISNAENEVIQLTQDMLDENDALIDKYEELTNAVGDQYQMLKDLMGEYEDAANKAKEAAEDAYEYIMKAKEAEAKDYAENVDTGPTTGGTGRYEGTQDLDTTTVTPVAKTTPNPPFSATLPRGTALYNANGYQYPKGTQADRTVTVEAEANGRYRVWGSTFNPHTVYVDKNAVRYDTGGYTGAWGTEGRMAMLHEKELVLNKKDTANMLNAVDILRGITDSIGADVLDKMASMKANGLNMAMGANALDQNVHIEATFPGVTSSIEIQDALNNLVNMAAQRATRTR